MFLNRFILYILLLCLAGCGNMGNDLFPSGTDKRPVVQQGTAGSAVGQNASDFTVSDSLGNSVTLSAVLPQQKAVVLYFTMWCPICDSHMTNMRDAIMPGFPAVRFFIVDYVSGSVADARNAQVSNGYANSGFTVLADTGQEVLGEFHATMGTTVVIDSAGVILMNEDYKDGSRLQAVLSGL